MGFLLLIHDLLLQSELIRFIASYKPLIAGANVSERIITIIKHLLFSQMPSQVWTCLYDLSFLELPDLQHHSILILEM